MLFNRESCPTNNGGGGMEANKFQYFRMVMDREGKENTVLLAK